MTDVAELLSHVEDSDVIHFPFGELWPVPQPFEAVGVPIHMTKFIWLEILAALAMLVVFIPLGRVIARGGSPRGYAWNFFETILVFIRDEIARPAIGRRDADRYLPYLWTAFFFILFCNLAGLIPWAGSPTGAWGVTGVMAAMTFVVVVGSGMRKFGPIHFWGTLVPPMEMPKAMAVVLVPMIFVIEVFGLVIRCTVLSIRLLATMFAGHLALGMVIAFIPMVATMLIWYFVAPVSVFGAVAISLLELFVAFLQAYIFTFLSALFIGMALHPH